MKRAGKTKRPTEDTSDPARPGLAQTGHGKRTQQRGQQGNRSEPATAEAAQAEIPANAYVVALPIFEGPLDLLLHVIQKHELNILDIPVGFVTEKYLEYLRIMRDLSIDLASEYLVMAATLAHIKSKMLLPDVPDAADASGEDDEAEDPRGELIRRLLEYQKYKVASEELNSRDTLGASVFPRGETEPLPEGPTPFAKLGVFELLDAFSKVLQRTNVKIEHEVVFDRISISERIAELTDTLKACRTMNFDELVLSASRDGRPLTRFDLVITFLAILEMARLRMMHIWQDGTLTPIKVELRVIDADEEADTGGLFSGMTTAAQASPSPSSEPQGSSETDDAGKGELGDE
ncbi:MAG: segregation/condensation protein A [Polyangiaceae bacterium]